MHNQISSDNYAQIVEKLLSHAGIGAIIINADFTVNRVSDRLLSLLGYNRKDLINKPFKILLKALG